MKPVAAGAVRKWKSAVTISKARTYRAVFCTAWHKTTAKSHDFQWYNVLSIYSHPPAKTSRGLNSGNFYLTAVRICGKMRPLRGGSESQRCFVPLLMLSCIVLLPIFPAYFLFKALPTASGSVAGTLAGLKIKLGGAFAGYFAVVLLIFLAHDIWNPAPLPPAYQVWEVSGQVTDEAGRIVEPLDVKDILLVPPTFQYSPGGHFSLTFATMPAPGGGIKYPILSVNYPNFQVATIPLDPAAARELDANMQLERDEARREISIKRVVLRKLPDYSPTGKAAPVPVSASEELHQ